MHSNSSIRSSPLVLCAWLVLFVLGPSVCAATVPVLPIEEMEPAVRTRMEALRARVEQAVAGGDASQQAAAFGELGRAAIAYSLVEVATVSLGEANRLDDRDGRWPYLLGALAQRQRQDSVAIGHLERAAALRPTDASTLVRLAQVRARTGDVEGARALFEQLRALPPFEAAARDGLGRLAAAADDHRAAVEHFTAALALQPAAGTLHQQLGMAYRALGEREKARASLVRDNQGAVRFPDPDFEALGADFPQGHRAVALAATQAGRPADAAEAYRRALVDTPDDLDALQGLAAALRATGDLEGAVDAYARAVEIRPDRAIFQLRLGNALLERDGSGGDALSYFARAVALAPDWVSGRQAYAQALERAGRLPEAASQLAAAVELDPQHREIRLAQARLALRRGQMAEARAAVDALSGDARDDAELLLLRARLAGQAGDVGEAIRYAEQALAASPAAPLEGLAQLRLGILRERQGERDRALGHLETAGRLLPRSPEVRRAWAGALGRAGRFDASAEQWRALQDIQPGDVSAGLGLAVALSSAGKPGAAKAALEGVIAQASPSTPGLARVHHTLAQLHLACAVPEVCDAEAAERHARAAIDARPTLAHAETLAAALAGLGRLDEAITLQERLVSQAERAGADASFLSRAREALSRYRQERGGA